MTADRPGAQPIDVVVVEQRPISARIIADALSQSGFAVSVRESAQSVLDTAAGGSVVVLGPSELSETWEPVVPRLVASGARVLVLSDDEFDDSASTLLFAGASGFLCTADAGADDLADAVRTVALGDSALNPSIVHEVLSMWRDRGRGTAAAATSSTTSPAAALTEREKQVVTLLSEGLTTRIIARQLGVAEKTIEAHKSRLFAKLGARNQAQAVAVARQRKLL